MHLCLKKKNQRWACILIAFFLNAYLNWPPDFLPSGSPHLSRTRWLSYFHTLRRSRWGFWGSSLNNSPMWLLCKPVLKLHFWITWFSLSFICRFCNCFPGEGVVGGKFYEKLYSKSLRTRWKLDYIRRLKQSSACCFWEIQSFWSLEEACYLLLLLFLFFWFQHVGRSYFWNFMTFSYAVI